MFLYSPFFFFFFFRRPAAASLSAVETHADIRDNLDLLDPTDDAAPTDAAAALDLQLSADAELLATDLSSSSSPDKTPCQEPVVELLLCVDSFHADA